MQSKLNLNLKQIVGGNMIKQGDTASYFTFELLDAKEERLRYIDNELAQVYLVRNRQICFETVGEINDGCVTFRIDKHLEPKTYFLEIYVDGYVFPSDYSAKIHVFRSAKKYVSDDIEKIETANEEEAEYTENEENTEHTEHAEDIGSSKEDAHKTYKHTAYLTFTQEQQDGVAFASWYSIEMDTQIDDNHYLLLHPKSGFGGSVIYQSVPFDTSEEAAYLLRISAKKEKTTDKTQLFFGFENAHKTRTVYLTDKYEEYCLLTRKKLAADEYIHVRVDGDISIQSMTLSKVTTSDLSFEEDTSESYDQFKAMGTYEDTTSVASTNMEDYDWTML